MRAGRGRPRFTAPGGSACRPAIAVLVLACLAGCRAVEEPASAIRGAGGDSAREAPGSPPARSAAAEPRLVGNPPAVRLNLPAALAVPLAASDSGFVTLTVAAFGPEITRGSTGWTYPWDERQAPFAVLADFDGDGARDVALLQRSPGEGRAVVVLADSAAPRVLELRRWTRADAGDTGPRTDFYLRLQPAGAMKVPDFGGGGADTTVTLAHEGIELVSFGKAARTYWYSNGAFTSLTTAD